MFYKRNIYWINPKFQLKFSLYVCAIVFLSSIIYPITIYDLMGSFIEYSHKINPELSDQLIDKRKSLVMVLGFWQFGLTALVFVICIFFGHKVAGPIYKVQKFLEKVREDKNHDKLFFRKGDYFPELADDLNKTFESIQEHHKEQHKRDFVYISEVNQYIKNLHPVMPEDKKNILHEISRRLTEIEERFNANASLLAGPPDLPENLPEELPEDLPT